MSVAEIGQLHSRYVRLSDKFKALWTYNQFATGVYKNLLQTEVPYKIDFQKIYEEIRSAGDMIQSSAGASAASLLDACERQLNPIVSELLAADGPISASSIRRFFEKLRRQDDKIIFNLIKFYLYADATQGEQRDKLDFLFTRIGEDYIEERGEYSLKDSVEIRKHLQGLTSILGRNPSGNNEEVHNLIKTIRTLKRGIQEAPAIEDLTSRNLLSDIRTLKQKIGDLYFNNDVLVAIIDCNVATKNHFLQLYKNEEEKIIEDSRKLLESEQTITASIGKTNPALAQELKRFKEFKQEFDDSRARSDVKHHTITQLKMSIDQLLSQLDQQFENPADWAQGEVLLYPEEVGEVEAKFGNDPQLFQYLQKIVSILNYFDPDISQDHITRSPEAKGLRMETWEIAAFQKLYWERQAAKDESEDLLLLYLRAAALRLKIEEEAQQLLAAKPARPEAALLERIRATLERSKELDRKFHQMLDGSVFELTPKTVRRTYRSRLRLMRSFTGLWLLYDQNIADERE